MAMHAVNLMPSTSSARGYLLQRKERDGRKSTKNFGTEKLPQQILLRGGGVLEGEALPGTIHGSGEGTTPARYLVHSQPRTLKLP